MSFKGIIGQREIINSLENAIRNDKVGHAYIFSGPKGIGKRTVAKAFGGLLMCQEPGHEHLHSERLEACNTCLSCRLAGEGTNPDFHVVENEEGSISVEDIRKLQSDIIIRPMYARKKVYLIVDADKMTVQAQNCLLKTLEEPPGYAVILLTVSNYDTLLETIHSRAARYSFKKNTRSEVREVVKARCQSRLQEIDFIVSYADGVIGTALELAGSEEFVRVREQTVDIVFKLTQSKLQDVFEIYDFFDTNKASVDTILDIMALFYRDLLVAGTGWKENILINSDKKDIILKNISKFSTRKLTENIEIIETTRKNLKYNANYQLAIEMMLMKLQED